MAVSNLILQKYLSRVDRLATVLYKKNIIAKPHRSLTGTEQELIKAIKLFLI